MDTTTPFLYYDNYTYDDFPDFNELLNRPAFIGCWITFIILTCLMNAVVIACVVCRCVKHPAVKTGSPKLLVILTCCVLQVVDALGPSSVGVHINRANRTETVSTFTCGAVVTLELSAVLLNAIVSLLVAVVILVEGLRLQRFVTLTPRVQLAAAAVLVALSVVYGAVVVVPVFFLLWLKDATQPCPDNSAFMEIDVDSYKAIAISDFIVPQCIVFVSCVLLLLVYFTRRHSAAHAYVQYNTTSPPLGTVSGLSSDAKTTNNSTDTAPSQSADPSVHIVNNPSGTPQHQTGKLTSPADSRFPWHVLLAAAVSFVFGFVFFYQTQAELNLPSDKRRKLWAAGVLLSAVKGVFLPCCWLLDGEVRAGCTCWRGSHTSGVTSRGPQEGGEIVTSACSDRDRPL